MANVLKRLRGAGLVFGVICGAVLGGFLRKSLAAILLPIVPRTKLLEFAKISSKRMLCMRHPRTARSR